MPMLKKPLEVAGGFVGPPVPRDEAGPGLPDMMNLCLVPGGTAVEPLPGHRRNYPYHLTDDATMAASVSAAQAEEAATTPTVADDDTVGDTAWTNPSNAQIYDEATYASVSGCSPSHYLKVTGLGYEIPTGATINGIRIGVWGRKMADTAAVVTTAHLLKAGAIEGDDLSDSEAFTRDLTGIIIGTTSSLWGETWTPAQVNHDDFGFVISITATPEVRIYWVNVGVSYSISSSPLQGISVVSLAPQAFETNGGRGLALVDDATERVVALGYQGGGAVVDPATFADQRTPQVLWRMHRHSPHDYPLLLPFRGRTHIVAPFEEQLIFDGVEVRKAGLRGPQMGPVVQSSVADATGRAALDAVLSEWDADWPTYTSDEENPFYADYYDGATYDWTADPGRTASDIDVRDYGGPPETHHKLSVKKAARTAGVLASRNIAPLYQADDGATISAGTSAIRVRVFYDAAHNMATTAAGTWGLVLSTETVGAGETITDKDHVVVPITQPIYKHRWCIIDLPWEHGDAAYTVKSLGWTLLKDIPEDHCDSMDVLSGEGVELDYQIWFLAPDASAGELDLPGGEDEKYRVAFSWYDAERYRESNLSPYSVEFALPENMGLTVDLSGWYEWGAADEMRDATALLGLQNSNPDPVHVDKVRVYLHRAAWGVDPNGYPAFRLYGEYDIPTADADGKLTLTLGGEQSEEDLLLAPGPHYDLDVPPAVRAAVVDGERMLLGNQPAYSVGRLSITDGYHYCTRVTAWANDADSDDIVYAASDPSGGGVTYTESTANTAIWGPWLEGRQLRIAEQGNTYRIVKALANASGVYDRLAIVRDAVDGFEAYDGTTYSAARYEIVGEPNRVWMTSKTVERGTYPEAVSPFAYMDLEMPGDEVIVMGHVGDFVCVVGRENLIFMIQDRQSLDDVLATGAPFPQPRTIFGCPGCVSGRSFTQLPNRTAMYLTPEGQLALVTGNGATVHEVSERMRGWLTSDLRIDTNSLRHAHALYDKDRQWYVLFLPDADSTDDAFGDWGGDAPPEPRHEGWTS